MLGDFISRGLIVILGYAYPAFECFKTVEKNKVEIDELRFWCQYWIIIASMAVCERIGDIFICWMPLYGELKLAFVVYLWYPKTKGTNYIYESFVRPYVSKHEKEIDRRIQEMRIRAWNLVFCYWHHCTDLGQSAVFHVLQQLANHSPKLQNDDEHDRSGSPLPPADLNLSSPHRHRCPKDDIPRPSPPLQPQDSNKKRPSQSKTPSTLQRSNAFPSSINKSADQGYDAEQEQSQTEFSRMEDVPEQEEEMEAEEAQPNPIQSTENENGLLKSAQLSLLKSNSKLNNM